MNLQETCLYISIAGILLFFVTLSMILTIRPSKESELQDLVDGRTGVIQHQNKLKAKLEKTGFYIKRKCYLQQMIALTFDRERTPDSIFQYQMITSILTIALTIILHSTFRNFLITAAVFIGMSVMTLRPDIALRSNLSKKCEDFDNNLPSFLNNMLLAMQAGSGIEKSMAMSIETLEGDIKEDFLMLLNDTKTYTDDISKAYMNLSKRIQTKDCERFSNVVISGLKNGNKMSDILRDESSHLNKEQINKMLERGNKNKIKATAISTGLIFMPILVILIAPMMATSM